VSITGTDIFLGGTGKVNVIGAQLVADDYYWSTIPVVAGGSAVMVGGSGRLYVNTAPSNSKYKTDIEQVHVDLESLATIGRDLISWRYRDDVPFHVDDPGETFYGVRADQMHRAGGLDFLLGYGADGEVHDVKERRMIWAVLKGWAEDHRRLVELTARIEALEAS
jgi:hypothetical protein